MNYNTFKIARDLIFELDDINNKTENLRLFRWWN